MKTLQDAYDAGFADGQMTERSNPIRKAEGDLLDIAQNMFIPANWKSIDATKLIEAVINLQNAKLGKLP